MSKVKGHMSNIYKRGFTLVEILVVVSIVGLLSSVFVIGLGGVRSRGRDTKRIADIKQMQTAMELYYSKCGWYPGGATGGTCNTTNPTTWTELSTTLTDGAKLGISRIPNDPVVGEKYYYAVRTDRQSYVLAGILENPKDPSLAGGTISSLPAGYTFTDAGTAPNCSLATSYCVQF